MKQNNELQHFLLSNFCNLISVRLDNSNYVTWKFLLETMLKGCGLLRYIDGSFPCPPRHMIREENGVTSEMTKEYINWEENDSAVMSILASTLSSDVLSFVVGSKTSRELWCLLKERYASTSWSNRMHLKTTFQDLQKGSDSIDQYLLRVKIVCDQLANVGVHMSDEDIIVSVLHGLPSEFATMKTIIRTKKSLVSMQELRSLLLIAEDEIELATKSIYLSSNPAMVAYSNTPREIYSSAKFAKRQYDQLHDRFLNLTSAKDAMQLVNQELNNKVVELQKIQESVMVQLSAECHIARERIQKLESEAEALVSKKIETEKLVSELELQIDSLSESSRSSENKMQDLLLKISALETENKDNAEKLQAELRKKAEQIDGLLKEGEANEQHVDSMDKLVSQLHITLEEKEHLILQYMEREKNLEKQITENRTLLTAAETRIVEDKKKYDLVLESKQLELSRHLKDIFQRNDQAINDIWKKYEVGELEIVNMEKRKAEKQNGDLLLVPLPPDKNNALLHQNIWTLVPLPPDKNKNSGATVFTDSDKPISTYDAALFRNLLTHVYNPSADIKLLNYLSTDSPQLSYLCHSLMLGPLHQAEGGCQVYIAQD